MQYELIMKLVEIYQAGWLEDIMILKGGYTGVSIKQVDSVETLIDLAVNQGYNSLAVKIPGKLRYEKEISLPDIENFRVNKKSIVIEYKIKRGVGIFYKKPDTKISWY